MKQELSLSPTVLRALSVLHAQGFSAYAVGGCVRDLLLGKTPHDWDIATSARPEEVKASFPHVPVVETGISHGTLTVCFEGMPLEVTTFRTESGYADHRHPDGVRFASCLEEDLARRDFTVNSMACGSDGVLIDPFGGREDLSRKLIRAVGDPALRFGEDALRILRGLRFASVLGFSIEPATAEALLEKKEDLSFVSAERIGEELKKLLAAPAAPEVIERFAPVLFFLLPELRALDRLEQRCPYHCCDVWNHTLAALRAAPPEAVLRAAVLFHDLGKAATKTTDQTGTDHFYGHAAVSAELAGQILSRYRFPNAFTEEVVSLIRRHIEVLPLTEKRLKKLAGAYSPAWVRELLALMRADTLGQTESVSRQRLPLLEDAEKTLDQIESSGACLSRRDLAVNGNDLLLLGFPEGPSLGKALDFLLEQVWNGAPNERDALLAMAERLLAEESSSPAGSGTAM